ncbi:hypothetical protein LCGC14_2988060 [marine sediment metagenome]|uniref:Uncharacterized protein n=1 Tax=marine sediment metagenome TaxID=412755 RepID=A0A0F8XS76_9ZZZZ
MGYWNQTEEGCSLVKDGTGLIWGDQPADAMDDALEKIIDHFRRDWERLPTKEEIMAGLLFSLDVTLQNARD